MPTKNQLRTHTLHVSDIEDTDFSIITDNQAILVAHDPDVVRLEAFPNFAGQRVNQ